MTCFKSPFRNERNRVKRLAIVDTVHDTNTPCEEESTQRIHRSRTHELLALAALPRITAAARHARRVGVGMWLAALFPAGGVRLRQRALAAREDRDVRAAADVAAVGGAGDGRRRPPPAGLRTPAEAPDVADVPPRRRLGDGGAAGRAADVDRRADDRARGSGRGRGRRRSVAGGREEKDRARRGRDGGGAAERRPRSTAGPERHDDRRAPNNGGRRRRRGVPPRGSRRPQPHPGAVPRQIDSRTSTRRRQRDSGDRHRGRGDEGMVRPHVSHGVVPLVKRSSPHGWDALATAAVFFFSPQRLRRHGGSDHGPGPVGQHRRRLRLVGGGRGGGLPGQRAGLPRRLLRHPPGRAGALRVQAAPGRPPGLAGPPADARRRRRRRGRGAARRAGPAGTPVPRGPAGDERVVRPRRRHGRPRAAAPGRGRLPGQRRAAEAAGGVLLRGARHREAPGAVLRRRGVLPRRPRPGAGGSGAGRALRVPRGFHDRAGEHCTRPVKAWAVTPCGIPLSDMTDSVTS